MEVETRIHCKNCKDELKDWRLIPLCPICRRTYGWGAAVGGVITGILVKLFS